MNGSAPVLISAAIERARVALEAGRGGEAVIILEPLVVRAPCAGAWQLLGFAYAVEPRMPEAVRAFAQAASLDPEEPRTATMLWALPTCATACAQRRWRKPNTSLWNW